MKKPFQSKTAAAARRTETRKPHSTAWNVTLWVVQVLRRG